MSFQTMSRKQLTCLFIKWTWQNNRPIVLFTVFAQLFALALVPWTLENMGHGFPEFHFSATYYNQFPMILMGCLSAIVLGYTLKKQNFQPFQFPEIVKRRGNIIVVLLYSALLTLAIGLTQYVIWIYLLMIWPQPAILRAPESFWSHVIILFCWLMISSMLGFLYAICRRAALLVSGMLVAVAIISLLFFDSILYSGTVVAVIIVVITLMWMMRQEVSGCHS
ncbi:hypothetical protein [Kurthia huakuii]|uniref:hypothetical protein n=2 Tax=Kurthia huakuii TaxID=1421019 RepID=UPI000496530C|nr:hypothetical protein [Kurthia huakuii]